MVTLRLPRDEYYALLSLAQSRSMTLDAYLEKYVFSAMKHLQPILDSVDRFTYEDILRYFQLFGKKVQHEEV